MPASFDMTWDASARRWTRMHKGIRYKVSCRQLGVPETKEASRQAANDWWRSKLAEIENRPTIVPAWQGELARRIEWVDNIDGENPNRLLSVLELPDQVWDARFEATKLEATPTDESVGYNVSRYLDLERARVNSLQISMHEYDLVRLCLDYFREWLKPTTSVKTIEPDKWEDFWTHLMGLDCSVEYKKKRFRYAKGFVTWLASKGIVPMPANLMSRKYKFGSTTKKVPTMTVDEVRILVDASTGQLTLHLLLMANCGFAQQDVSELVQDEVNWKHGTITRQRSKTRHHEDVPTVTYQLWKRTFALLKQYSQQEGDLVLRTKSGQPWLTKRQVNGKFNRTDNTKSVYRHLQHGAGSRSQLRLAHEVLVTFLNRTATCHAQSCDNI
jgi:hypothetical protein